MIRVVIQDQKDKVIREFFFSSESSLSLKEALETVENYVIQEQLNSRTDCFIKAFYCREKQTL